MPKAPAFQFYAADFLTDEKVKLMNLQERGAYITLLAHCWVEKSIPSDLSGIAGLCSIDPRDMETIWQKVVGCFKKKGSRYVNSRLQKERRKQNQYRSYMKTLAE